MNLLPCDMIELVGSKLPSKDLAAFCRTSSGIARAAGRALALRRNAMLGAFRTEIRTASKILKTQVLRSMIRQLDAVPDLEAGGFPRFDAVEGDVIEMTAMPEWSFSRTAEGWLEAVKKTSCGVSFRASIAYGNTWTSDNYPERLWLGACISSVKMTSPAGNLLGEWTASRPWMFRNDDDTTLPADVGFVEDEVGMFWLEPMDLLAPASGTDVTSFKPWWRIEPKYEDHVRIADEELRDRVTSDDDPAAQVFAAWRDSAMVLLDRYRTRNNRPSSWLHTGYAVVTPDWMRARFPDAEVFDAFERALGPSWTVDKNISFRTVYARRPWRSGELVATYDVEANWRDVRFHDGKVTAIFRCEPPGLACVITKDAVCDLDAMTDDVKEFIRLSVDTGMPVVTY
jgi:hypothetical protein